VEVLKLASRRQLVAGRELKVCNAQVAIEDLTQVNTIQWMIKLQLQDRIKEVQDRIKEFGAGCWRCVCKCS
jgi:hypothetical protein